MPYWDDTSRETWAEIEAARRHHCPHHPGRDHLTQVLALLFSLIVGVSVLLAVAAAWAGIFRVEK